MKVLSPCILISLAMGLAGAQEAPEGITEFASKIQIEKSGDLVVTETITVLAEGELIQHGIYRDFPTRYDTSFGLHRKVGIRVLDVSRDGMPEPWTYNTQAVFNGVRISIGDEDQLLSPGKHTYQIRYRTTRQLTTDGNVDELTWNVTGLGWDFPIAHASALVELPPGATVTSSTAYTGPQGAKGKNWQLVPSAPGTVAFQTTSALAMQEGLTVSVTWPKGFLSPGAIRPPLLALLSDNLALVGSFAVLLLVFVYYIAAWVALGQHPPPGVIIPQYAPPKGFTPAAVRFVVGLGKVDEKSFAAAVLQLAVAGALKIVKEENFAFVKLSASPELLPGQKRFFDALFGSQDRVEITPANARVLEAAQKELSNWLSRDFEKEYFKRNAGIRAGGVILSLVAAGLALMDSDNGVMAGIAAFALIVLSVTLVRLLPSLVSQFRTDGLISTLPQLAPTFLFLLLWVGSGVGLYLMSSLWTVLVVAMCAFWSCVIYHVLKAPTMQGRKILDHIEGFKHYLAVAERDRLDLENPPERTPELFEKFLPYALALDVEQRWSEQFSEALEAATYQPQWVDGAGLASLTAMDLASSLGDGMSTAVASSTSMQNSSSGSNFSSGGFSGGGGGGGGGGGW